MDSPHSPLEFALLNAWQRDFPIVARPFEWLGARVGAGETAILATLERLQARGAISRVGAVLAPRRVGASTLAALAAPAAQMERIAALVSARPEVNHNYQREHAFNLWFVVTAADQAALAATLGAIEGETGCAVISLPLEQEYHIDLGFDLQSPHKHHAEIPGTPAREPDAAEKRLIAALQPGLELVARPFARLGERAGMSEREVLSRIDGWIEEGLIKRFGVVVRHHELGYRANAMVVFDVPDAEADAIGRRLAAEPGVTLCYRRRRNSPHWPYNLYCMVHGRSRQEVQPVIEGLSRLVALPAQALFSTRRFKQCGARYFAESPALAEAASSLSHA
ncbi:MAG: AsnC family transcriptional regulator [Rhodocyclales bacterium RIFCSPLOWO2_02_FULL_63_24]|nr:MAG: AsnC family transcriptional regulator [Rhodocyclales bacterium GWA2_65_19]OHC71666.1 MAG: AsnC family transcriptional regulator [Rhodocyclales bacterium RIFCSPLOWO2_02_FULL_63_24]